MREFQTVVIILNWNNLEDTEACLNALQQSETPIQVVVVDNASTQKGIDDLCVRYKNVTLLKNKENLGFGRGNNVGLKWALENTQADYFFILNNDAFIKADTIAKLEDYLNNHPKVACVTPQIVFADKPDKIWYVGGTINAITGCVKPWHWGKEQRTTLTPYRVEFVSGCAILIRRQILTQLGGFDPRYFMYEEDVEYSLRLKKYGFLAYCVPQALLLHKVQGSHRKHNTFINLKSSKNPNFTFITYHRTANRLLTMHKHSTDFVWLLFVFYNHIFLLYQILQFTICGRVDAIQAIINGYRNYLNLRHGKCIDQLKTTTG